MSNITIVKYNSLWPQDFEAEKELVLSNVPIKGMVLHHIGSTSVKSLASKPIIDILIELPKVETLDEYSNQFKRLGYEPMGEFGISGRRYFRKGLKKRTHHIHAFNSGTDNAKRHLAFRDYLATHQEIAKAYESVKYSAVEMCNGDNARYCELKNDFVVYHEKLAMQWSEQA